MTLFSRQVSPAVAKKIWTQRDQLVSDGRVLAQEIRATIWVSDLTGFAAISHAMSSGDLIKWLNEYTSAVFELVEKHGGIIDKYVGDMVLAVFGAPIRTTQEESASSAVACALEMRARFAELKARWGTQTILGMRMRVGIHTGQLVTGTIGSGEREAYAVIGDAVNVAQALVAYDKAVMDTDIAADGCRIIVSDATRQLLGGQFRVRKIGELEIASPAQAGAIHGVIQ
jgi:adenylate cyclase